MADGSSVQHRFLGRQPDRAKQQDGNHAQLRAKLIELIKAQGKPFGLLIDDIAGDSRSPDAGNRRRSSAALVVYKVYADGGLTNWCAEWILSARRSPR